MFRVELRALQVAEIPNPLNICKLCEFDDDYREDECFNN